MHYLPTYCYRRNSCRLNAVAEMTRNSNMQAGECRRHAEQVYEQHGCSQLSSVSFGCDDASSAYGQGNQKRNPPSPFSLPQKGKIAL